MSHPDYLVVGGGVLGLSVAWGLVRKGVSVTVLDSSTNLPRASTANFGLVWLQSKGANFPAYGAWSRRAVDLWPAFAESLQSASGVNPKYLQSGGFSYCVGQAEWESRGARVASMSAAHAVDPYGTTMIDREELARRMPGMELGRDVCGASWNPHDGAVDPLRLMHCLRVGLQKAGVVFQQGVAVEHIRPHGQSFTAHGGTEQYHAGNVVLAAGLGNAVLASQLGLYSQVRADRGQILVTERVPWRLPYPASQLRQSPDGTILIGATQEGPYTDTQATDPMRAIAMATRATRIFPVLRGVRVVRSWAGLRTLSKDSAPVYDRRPDLPGATVVNSHSGISLAALHASILSDWIFDGSHDKDIAPFSPARFDVPPPP